MRRHYRISGRGATPLCSVFRSKQTSKVVSRFRLCLFVRVRYFGNEFELPTFSGWLFRESQHMPMWDNSPNALRRSTHHRCNATTFEQHATRWSHEKCIIPRRHSHRMNVQWHWYGSNMAARIHSFVVILCIFYHRESTHCTEWQLYTIHSRRPNRIQPSHIRAYHGTAIESVWKLSFVIRMTVREYGAEKVHLLGRIVWRYAYTKGCPPSHSRIVANWAPSISAHNRSTQHTTTSVQCIYSYIPHYMRPAILGDSLGALETLY